MAPPESLQDENGQTVFKGHQQVCAQASCVRVAVCVAARCRVCCSALPCVLQRVAMCCNALQEWLRDVAVCVAARCSMGAVRCRGAELQRVAACCNVLQSVAVCVAVRCRVAARCAQADYD